MSSFFKKIFQPSNDSKSVNKQKCSLNVSSSSSSSSSSSLVSEASKKKLMRRLALAQNDPEPLLDLSDSELTKIDEQILTLIKVYHKQRIHLERNRLSAFHLTNSNHFSNVTVLHLEDNQIASFEIASSPVQFANLKELYLNGNQLTSLPAQLFRLPQLKVLSARHNLLSKVPSELLFGAVGAATTTTIIANNKLVYCDLAFNHIGTLPPQLSIVNIPNQVNISLQTLNLEGNPLHTPTQQFLASNCHDVSCFLQISACLARFYNLTQFQAESMSTADCNLKSNVKQFNEQSIVEANKTGNGLSNKQQQQDGEEDDDDDDNDQRDEIDDRFKKYAQKKLEAKQNKIEFERNYLATSNQHHHHYHHQQTESPKACLSKLSAEQVKVTCKDKLLQELCTEQDVLFERINQFHSKKDVEKQKILDNYVAQLQEHSSRLIEKLSLDAMILSTEGRGNTVAENGESDSTNCDELSRDICQLLSQYDNKLALKRNCLLNSLEAATQQEEEILNQSFQRKDDVHSNIFKQLEKQEESLSQAFEKLLADRDRRNYDLTEKISLVEQELLALTFIERERKDVRNDQILSDLYQQRAQLAQFLATLLDLKRQREKKLKELIQQEMCKRFEGSITTTSSDQTGNSWIEQLQILLQKEPFEVQVRQFGIDVRVANILTTIYDDLETSGDSDNQSDNSSMLQNKLVYYLPHFIDMSFERFATSTASDLLKVFTIDDYELCEFIEKQVDKVLAQQKLSDNYRNTVDSDVIYKSATSPELIDTENNEKVENGNDQELNSRQIWYESECVICLSNQSDIVFLPCGHICTCQSCIRPNASTVSLCPLCREEIDFMQTIVAG